jgi:hypothetical protein
MRLKVQERVLVARIARLEKLLARTAKGETGSAQRSQYRRVEYLLEHAKNELILLSPRYGETAELKFPAGTKFLEFGLAK